MFTVRSGPELELKVSFGTIQLSVRDAPGPRKGLEAQPWIFRMFTFFRPDESGQRAAKRKEAPCPPNFLRPVRFPIVPICAT